LFAYVTENVIHISDASLISGLKWLKTKQIIY